MSELFSVHRRLIGLGLMGVLVLALAVLGSFWALTQTASAQDGVELVHLSPDGTDFPGNPYCPETVWSADGKAKPVTVDPRHDCNNITSQKHIIRTDGFDPLTMSDPIFDIEGVGTILGTPAPCNTIPGLVAKAGWSDDDGDGLIDEDPDNEGIDDDGDYIEPLGDPEANCNGLDDDAGGADTVVDDGCWMDEDPADGVDNDDDGTEDGWGAAPLNGDCDDGLDNDLDGTDWNDAECWWGVDEDWLDCADNDWDCPGDTNLDGVFCGCGPGGLDIGVDEDPPDGIDNDNDANESGWSSGPGTGNCTDGLDNDGDGTDWNDPECWPFDGEDPIDADDDGDCVGSWPTPPTPPNVDCSVSGGVDEDPPGNAELADEWCVVIHSKDPGETSIRVSHDNIWSDAIHKQWDKMTDTVILKPGDGDIELVTVPGRGKVELPVDANRNGKRDADDGHILDHNGETQNHGVIWDEGYKRLRSSSGLIRIIDVVHGQHGTSGWEADHPTEGAIMLALIDSPGCTYFTNPTVAIVAGAVYQPGELNLGTALVGVSDWRGFFVGPKIWPVGAQFSAEALAEASAHNLSPGLSNNSGVFGAAVFEANYVGVYIDTVCEEQAKITFKAGYPDYVQSVPEIPDPEWVVINWTTVQASKQPQIRWAGEEIVLEKRWAPPGEWYPEPGGIDDDLDGAINEDCGCPLDDEDGDGLIDEDPDDDIDNDGDMADHNEDGTDAAVPGDGDCVDGVDNDADTKIDADDSSCDDWIDEDVPDDDDDGLVDEDPLDLCPLAGSLVKYVKLGGPGGLISGLPDVGGMGASEAETVWTYIDDECVSRALYSSEEPGQVDVEAVIVSGGYPKPVQIDGGGVYNKHAFLVWYLKIYQLRLTNVPGEREYHNDGKFSVADGADLYDPSAGDVVEETLNVSQDALLRVRVKGWFYGGNNSSRGDVCVDMDGDGDGAGSEPGVPYPTTSHEGCVDANDEMLPAGYWVLPDDLPALAGPHPDRLADWDVMSEPDVTADDLIGPKSTLDSHDNVTRVVVPCVQPKIVSGVLVDDWTCTRKTIDPDGAITEADALMPPLKIFVRIDSDGDGVDDDGDTETDEDAGFLKPADKDTDVGITSAYESVMIPANPEIPAIVNNGGYDWQSWGSWVTQYDYPFFFPLTKTETADGFITDFHFYTDNRGEGFFFANGDYNLSFDDCVIQELFGAPDCSEGDVVGSTDITVIGDYPYFRKHPAVESNPVTKTWTWGGFKEVTAERIDATHTAIIGHVKDRDGYCKWDVDVDEDDAEIEVTFSPSLNPVQGEEIEFRLNTGIGSIVGISYNATYNVAHTPLAEALVTGAEDGFIYNAERKAVALAEDVRVMDGMELLDMVPVGSRDPMYEDECQAWILIEHPADQDPDVSVYFHDPEGIVTRHWPTSTLLVNLVTGWNDACYVGPSATVEDAAEALLDDVNENGVTDLLAIYRYNVATDPATWDRWFPEAAEGVNNIETLEPYDQLFVLMEVGIDWLQEITPEPASAALVEGWNSVCYAGDSKGVEDATANVLGDFQILYTLAYDQMWRRFVPGEAWLTNIVSLNQYTSVFLLVTTEGGATWIFDP